MNDFDFRIGKNRHLRGSGWRGLVALGMILIFAAALVALVSTAATPAFWRLPFVTGITTAPVR